MSDTEVIHGLASGSPLVTRKAKLKLRQSDSNSIFYSYIDDHRETQSDCEIVTRRKSKKSRSAKLAATLSSSLKRLGSVKKLKDTRQMSHVPALVAGLNNIAFGIGAAGTLCSTYPDQRKESVVSTKSMDSFSVNSDSSTSIHRTNSNDNPNIENQQEPGNPSANVDLLMEEETKYLDENVSPESNNGSSATEIQQPESDSTTSKKQEWLLYSKDTWATSSSDDSIDELDSRFSCNHSSSIHSHRPVRRYPKFYKSSTKVQSVNSTGSKQCLIPPEMPLVSDMTNDTDDNSDELTSGPSPFKRNFHKSYRVAITKLNDTRIRSGSNSDRTRQVIAHRLARRRHPSTEILTPTEDNSKSAAFHNLSTVENTPKPALASDFVSITDLQNCKLSDKSHLFHPDNYSQEIRNRPSSSSDVPASTNGLLKEPSPRSQLRSLYQRDNSQILNSDRKTASKNLCSTESDSDSPEETNTQRASEPHSPNADYELGEEIAPLKQAIPRPLKHRKTGLDSVRRLRDRRVDILLLKQSQELQRSYSLTNFSSNEGFEQVLKYNNSVKGVSLGNKYFTIANCFLLVYWLISYIYNHNFPVTHSFADISSGNTLLY